MEVENKTWLMVQVEVSSYETQFSSIKAHSLPAMVPWNAQRIEDQAAQG